MYHIKEEFETENGKNHQIERYFTMDYGAYTYREEGQWQHEEDGEMDMTMVLNPYVEAQAFEHVAMTLEHEGDNYKLTVIREEHQEQSSEMFDVETGKDSMVKWTSDRQREVTYIIDATTLLPVQKQVKELNTEKDFWDNMSYTDLHTVLSYDLYNKINSKKILKKASEIAQK